MYVSAKVSLMGKSGMRFWKAAAATVTSAKRWALLANVENARHSPKK